MNLDTASSWADLRRMNDHELSRLVESGRQRDSWMGMSSTTINRHFRTIGKLSDDESAQHALSVGLAPLHEWTDHLGQPPSTNALAPILVALASLPVGDSHSQGKRWQTSRNVDIAYQPHGYNIHIKMVQDKVYKARYPVSRRARHASYLFTLIELCSHCVQALRPSTTLSTASS